MKSFHSLSDDTLINISQYLTVKEMNGLSGLTSVLAKSHLGHSIFVRSVFPSGNKENVPFSPISSIPFITCNLLCRNHLTPHEFSVLYSGIKKRFVCSYVKPGMFHTLQHGVMHLTHTCQKNALIESIIGCFCSKITHLDWREDFYDHSPIAGLVDEHGHTPLQVQALRQYFNMFPNIQALTLRSYHIQKWCGSESDLPDLEGRKFFVSECTMNLVYSIYTNAHYEGYLIECNEYGLPVPRIWRSCISYYKQYGCMGVVTFRYNFPYITVPPHVSAMDIALNRAIHFAYAKQVDAALNQFVDLQSQTKTSKVFEDYVVCCSDLYRLKMFIDHVSEDVENCNSAIRAYTKRVDSFLP